MKLPIIAITFRISIIGTSIAPAKGLKALFKEIVVTYKIRLLEPHKVKFYLIWNYKRLFKKNWNPPRMKNISKGKEGRKVTKFVNLGDKLNKH